MYIGSEGSSCSCQNQKHAITVYPPCSLLFFSSVLYLQPNPVNTDTEGTTETVCINVEHVLTGSHR